MAEFGIAIAGVLEREGSELFIDATTGEVSRYGVTLKLAAGLHMCAADDAEFIKKLSEDRARQVYLSIFWTPLNLDVVIDQDVASKVLDMCVNMGVPQGVKLLQQALNELGAKLSVDGKMGRCTMLAVNAAVPYQLLMELRAMSLGYYHGLIEKHPILAKYWDGWKRRAEA